MLKYSLPMLAMLAAQAAYADDAAGAAEKKNWKGEAELGVLVTTGNSESTNVKGRLNVTQDLDKWRNNYQLESLYTKSDGDTTAEKYRAAAQGDYKIDKKQFWFVRGSYDDDRFSGYDYQLSTSTGYGNRFWETDEGSFFEASGGLGYRYNRFNEADVNGDMSEQTAIARLAAKFEYKLSATSLFRQELNSEIGLSQSNAITESVTSLQANVMGNLAMKVSFRVKYSSNAPDDAKSTDTETSFTLLYGF
ncbi:DUF481 domain-containing protein [Gallaecimonas kandeliae]|uniref:DUF481 domain-containing protein n=1 Tax=Gallaecimonas kandeliae TaxID=3029055 RepID=UPI0026489AB1|nr:DUF481 domain-containing protein [Gallaecimonas kandeliae]WKE65130.1 DUF481 domain-containing protein [Gallaecimonas kandeliae]